MKWNDCVLIAFGFVVGAVMAAVIEAVALPYKLFLGTDGRLQWETLVTGVAAVLVAGLTIAKLNEQIRQTGQLATDQRQRRARAARAMLPLALSEFAEYATACTIRLYALRLCFQSDGSVNRALVGTCLSTWTTPHVPENVLSLLKECIEFVDDTPAEAMTDLIRHFQVQNFRLAEDISRLRLNDGVHLLLWANIEQGIRDAAELHARAGALYSFARGNPSNAFAIDRTGIYNALFVAGCFENLHEIGALADEWQRSFLAKN